MRFLAAPPSMGYYAEAPDAYGYYAETPEAYGYYAAAPAGYGYYANLPDSYGEYEPMGYYGEYEPMGYYGEATEMPGYAEYDPTQAGMAGYGEGYSGYVRETRPRYNPGCPMPTNVHGFGEAEVLQGYVKPSTVNPTCGQFASQPGQEPPPPDNFKPLW